MLFLLKLAYFTQSSLMFIANFFLRWHENACKTWWNWWSRSFSVIANHCKKKCWQYNPFSTQNNSHYVCIMFVYKVNTGTSKNEGKRQHTDPLAEECPYWMRKLSVQNFSSHLNNLNTATSESSEERRCSFLHQIFQLLCRKVVTQWALHIKINNLWTIFN